MTDQTIDMTALSAKHTEADAARRIRRRHWAEFRLRAYGIAAISVAVIALAILLFTVLSKTMSVTEEYYLSLDVELELTDRQLAQITDDNPRTNADLARQIRAALKDAAQTDLSRRALRPLNDLIAGYEGYALSEIVSADPELVGERYHFEALLSDDVQMYLKGHFGRFQDVGSEGTITISAGADEGDVVITAPTSTFSLARQLMQADRAAEARRLSRQAADQARAYNETQALIAQTDDAAEKERLTQNSTRFAAERDRLDAAAAAALHEATDLQNEFTLRTDDPSVFVRASKGWIKITRLGRERMVGTIMDPLEKLGTVEAGAWSGLVFERAEAVRQLSDRQIVWIENFKREDRLVEHTNWRLLSEPDSREAEYAGIWTALVGSFWTMIVTFLLAFPIGVMASIYLEEFAPKNRLTQFIEVNINNLAAVPSIVFGLLGLTILLSGVSLFGVDLFDGVLKAFTDDPRSTPLAGGVVLALMSLPTIIIASRASIKAVPPSIRDAALGLGASKLQTSTHHVLPLAMPGILTGSIIAMAQALGETAPLIIIGMNSFVQAPPADPLEPASVLPSLIYLWNNNPERLFDGKTAAAISVLLIFLILMNALAVLLRKRFERRW